jgi:hypothetical protein
VPSRVASPGSAVPAVGTHPAPERPVADPGKRAPSPSTKPAGRHAPPAKKDGGTAGPLGVLGVGRRAASTGGGVAALVVVALVVLLLFPMVASRWARRRS